MATHRAHGRRAATAANRVRFEDRLVLANWMLDLFQAGSFEDLAKHMRAPEFEGFTEEGASRFHHCLKLLFDRPELPQDVLLAYDENIVRHWKRITENRDAEGHTLYPKYFQYLCLLFTEIYLDRYLRAAEKLLADLNAYCERFNAGETAQQRGPGRLFASGLAGDARIEPYVRDDLRKLAFCSATGSGKTLLMHINILQYQHYLAVHGREHELNRIVLLTPNEGLSLQHREEFALSGMAADLFEKDAGTLFAGRSIEIIDVHKLRESSGEKTVSVDAFEGNNLVLVDEGHRGTSGAEVGHWMQMRNRLCEKGFSFEYSATFGQAMRASANKDLAREYAKCILFDYSYKYFYGDGYGKDYRILNLEDDSNEEHRRRYLTACLLTFYQQQRLFQDGRDELRRYLIDKPLWIFVGGSVTKAPRMKDVSDVVDILLLLARFVRDRAATIRYLDMLLAGRSGLRDQQGRDLFAGSFSYLGRLGMTGEAAYRDILQLLFNASEPGAVHARRLRGSGEAEGEVALHLGEGNEPFGLINVGDPSRLCRLCEQHPDDLAVSDSEFSESLFRHVNDADSRINVLVGAKKFSEGWSSWRVSTMGLMNVGRKEGPQIIQLFGRGVRLKGIDYCLKRSRRVEGVQALREVERLETLNIFGIRADYMRQFKEYLEDEGLPANEERIEFVLPVVRNLGRRDLKVIRVKEEFDFKKQGPNPTLGLPDAWFARNRIVVDWYPRVQALASMRGGAHALPATPNEAHFEAEHVAFLDMDTLYFDLQRLKNERAWYNLNLGKERLLQLLLDPTWYVLYAPSELMEPRSFSQVRDWQQMATVLLRRYCDRLYRRRKAQAERDHLEYHVLTEEDANLDVRYRFLIDQSREDIVRRLEEIKELIQTGALRNVEFQGLGAIMFERHLYQPLIHVEGGVVEVKPVPLNDGERDFVLDLQRYCERNGSFFNGKELYLLRNMARGRGIGFFEAAYFYPDFILWLVADGGQYISFIDPKGLRNLQGPTDPKIAFYQTIKEIERDLRVQDATVTLNSFIISNTRLPEISWWSGGMTKEQFEERHVLFQQEDRDTYIAKILTMAMAD